MSFLLFSADPEDAYRFGFNDPNRSEDKIPLQEVLGFSALGFQDGVSYKKLRAGVLTTHPFPTTTWKNMWSVNSPRAMLCYKAWWDGFKHGSQLGETNE